MDATAIVNAVKDVTKKWAKQRRREEREASAAARRRQALVASHRVTIKEVAYEVMEQSYLDASASGTLPTLPRQIFYRARPRILQATGAENLDGQYFAQKLLVPFMAENRETTAAWDIVWDDRGHFIEPHTGKVIGLGTLAVREYVAWVEGAAGNGLSIPISILRAFPTAGPRNRFQAVLFIEKEGFMPLFEHVRLAQRFDLALMSTKGQSVTAARRLIDHLCGTYRIPLLVLHDFDKSGFSIAGTIGRSTCRYSFINDVEVIDLGLRLKDVREHDLPSERVVYGKSNPAQNLRTNSATDAEMEFLCSERSWPSYAGQRVELNAFASDALVAWIEGKLTQHAIKKVVPDAATLELAYRRAAEIDLLKRRLEEIRAAVHEEAQRMPVPPGLAGKVRRRQRERPEVPWDTIIGELAGGQFVKTDGS
jgi:hypothetical protein